MSGHTKGCVRGLLAMAAACVAACATVPPADPAVADGAMRIGATSTALYEGLKGKTAPACGFDANQPAYAQMTGDAAALGAHVAAGPADASLARAVTALGKVVAGAERSHRAASATVDDPSGPCLAPEVITLNESAIARATGAIADLERARGGR